MNRTTSSSSCAEATPSDSSANPPHNASESPQAASHTSYEHVMGPGASRESMVDTQWSRFQPGPDFPTPGSPAYEALFSTENVAEEAEEDYLDSVDWGDRPRRWFEVPELATQAEEELEDAEWELQQAIIIRGLFMSGRNNRMLLECPSNWTRGPPDRPERGRYPETKRWLVCQAYTQFLPRWGRYLACLPVSLLRSLARGRDLFLWAHANKFLSSTCRRREAKISPLSVAMAQALEWGFMRKARLFFELGADPEAAWACVHTEVWMNAFRWLLERRQVFGLSLDEFAFKAGSGVNEESGPLKTMVRFADRAPEMVRLLLDAKANPNETKWMHSGCPLTTAAKLTCGVARMRCLRLLLAAGASPNGWITARGHPSTQDAPLFAFEADPDCLKLLLQAGADPQAVFARGIQQNVGYLLDESGGFSKRQLGVAGVRLLLRHGALTLCQPEWRCWTGAKGSWEAVDDPYEDGDEDEDGDVDPDGQGTRHGNGGAGQDGRKLTAGSTGGFQILDGVRYFDWGKHYGIPPVTRSLLADAVCSYKMRDYELYQRRFEWAPVMRQVVKMPAPMARHCCKLAEDTWLRRLALSQGPKAAARARRSPPSSLHTSCALLATCSEEVLELWLRCGHPVSQECVESLRRKYPPSQFSCSYTSSEHIVDRGQKALSRDDETPAPAKKRKLGAGAATVGAESADARAVAARRCVDQGNDSNKGDDKGKDDVEPVVIEPESLQEMLRTLSPETQELRRQRFLEPAFRAVQRGTRLSSVVASLCLQAWVEDFQIRV